MPSIRARQDDASARYCKHPRQGELIISRTGFIIVLTICVLLTLSSLLALSAIAWRTYTRRRQTREASAWGRKSTYLRRMSHFNRTDSRHHRISLARKEVDRDFSNQYNGCLVNIPENPEMGSESPVEMMANHWGSVFEMPAPPTKVMDQDFAGKKGTTLVFNEAVGVWLPRR